MKILKTLMHCLWVEPKIIPLRLVRFMLCREASISFAMERMMKLPQTQHLGRGRDVPVAIQREIQKIQRVQKTIEGWQVQCIGGAIGRERVGRRQG